MFRTKSLSKNLVVWGTGTLLPSSLDPEPFRLFPLNRCIKRLLGSYKSQRQPDIRAVRGPKTRELLLKHGFLCPEVYGDPAILLPRFYKPKSEEKQWNAGVILHHTQTESGLSEALCKNGILLISIMRETDAQIEDFVDQIASCRRIYSSSLHGIIVSQAYGIPAQWIQIEGKPIQKDDRHKFDDYFLGAGQIVQDSVRLEWTDAEVSRMVDSIEPPAVQSFECADALMAAFPYDVVELAKH